MDWTDGAIVNKPAAFKHFGKHAGLAQQFLFQVKDWVFMKCPERLTEPVSRNRLGERLKQSLV